jgi:hypothetical protein
MRGSITCSALDRACGTRNARRRNAILQTSARPTTAQLCSLRPGSAAIACRALHDRCLDVKYGFRRIVSAAFSRAFCFELYLTLAAATSSLIPPALLTRARDVALEHKRLTERLTDGFDTRAAKKLGEYSPVVNALGEWDRANEVGTTTEAGSSDRTR